MRKLYVLLLTLFTGFTMNAQISVTVTGNTNTTPNLQTLYGSLAAALTDLNAVSAMAGPVILTCAAGGSETAPSTGLTIGSATLNPVLSSINTVTINTSSGTATLNAGVGTVLQSSTTATPDGILKLVGADYVTIDGLTFTDGNAANPATVEFGIALFKQAAGDGCNNNTIQNCVFNMQRINNANGPQVEGAVGILVAGSVPTAAHITLTPTNGGTLATNGTNSGNKFYGNTINGGNTGIGISGPTVASGAGPNPNAATFLGDLANEIGGNAPGTGNIILNYGGGGSNAAAGIRVNNQWSINISYNTINNNNGSGVNHAAILRGIYAQAGTSASATISNNTVTVKGAGTTTALTGIENIIGSTASANTVNITNNTVQNCTYATATTATFNGIVSTATAATVNLNNNQILNNSIGASGTTGSCTFMGIYGFGSATNTNMNGNTVSNNSLLNAAGTFRCIQGAISVVTANGNTISNNSIPNSAGAGLSSIYGIYNSAASPSFQNYTNNDINNSSIAGSSTATGHQVYGIVNATSGTSTITVSGNNINNLSFSSSGSGSATVAGIRNFHGTTVNVSKNLVHTLSSTGTAPTVAGIYTGSLIVTTINVFNNLIANLTTPESTTNSLHGIFTGTTGTNLNIYYNTIFLNGTSSGSGFSSSAMFMSSTTPTVTIRNNIFVNLSTPTGSGITAALRRASTSLTTYGALSNNNLFYAGTPSATNLIFYDGTNADQTLAAFKTTVTPREANSVTENVSSTPAVSFQNLTGPSTGSSNTFLHLVNGLSTAVESKGSVISGYTDDYDGDARNVSTPDIGADEFSGTILPANLLTFSGVRSGSVNQLKWTVAQETDVQEYEVERSEDGRTWAKAGAVASLGNTASQRNYAFADNNISSSKQYYRLRLVDRNGSEKLSNTVMISGVKATVLTLNGLFPNPAFNKVNLLVDAPTKDNVTILVIDAAGRVMKTQKALVETGSNTLQLNVAGLARGSYVVKAISENSNETAISKFVKE